MATKTGPQAFRVEDGTELTPAEATAAWAEAAHPVLAAVAGKYNSTITHKDLAQATIAAAGVETKSLVQSWIGPVLAQVARGCKDMGQPVLTSLCVRSDGSPSAAYGDSIIETYGGELPDDLDLHAAEERLRCYKFFGANIPADGGRPTLTPQVAARRRKAEAAAIANRPRFICPNCHLEIPLSGHCDCQD